MILTKGLDINRMKTFLCCDLFSTVWTRLGCLYYFFNTTNDKNQRTLDSNSKTKDWHTDHRTDAHNSLKPIVFQKFGTNSSKYKLLIKKRWKGVTDHWVLVETNGTFDYLFGSTWGLRYWRYRQTLVWIGTEIKIILR